MSYQDSFIVSEDFLASRLDKVLSQRYPEHSRSYLQWLIEEDAVLVNKKPCKKSVKLVLSDTVDITFLPTQPLDLIPEELPLDILYEDEHLIAVNKPKGLVVHPGAGNWDKTFVHGLLYHCQELEQDGSLRPGIVHRLDKDTTGVLVAAKTLKMHQELSALFAERKIEKNYHAIALGSVPIASTIETYIIRHPVHRIMMSVGKTGKYAKTHVKPIISSKELSFLEIAIETGRTHQIRVHLAHLGYPILGDALYGRIRENTHFRAERQMLHCSSLRFIHPQTKKELALTANIPDDMQHYIDYIGKEQHASSDSEGSRSECYS